MPKLIQFIFIAFTMLLFIKSYNASALTFEMTAKHQYSKETLHILDFYSNKFQIDAYQYLKTKNSEGVYQSSVRAFFKLETKKKKSIESLISLSLPDFSSFEAKDEDRVKHHIWKSFYLMNIMTKDKEECKKNTEFLRSMDFKVSLKDTELSPKCDVRSFRYEANLSANCDGAVLISKIDILRILNTSTFQSSTM